MSKTCNHELMYNMMRAAAEALQKRKTPPKKWISKTTGKEMVGWGMQDYFYASMGISSIGKPYIMIAFPKPVVRNENGHQYGHDYIMWLDPDKGIYTCPNCRQKTENPSLVSDLTNALARE